MACFEHRTLLPPDLHDARLDALIAPVAEAVICPAKRVLTMPGEEMDSIFYVRSGRAKLLMDNGDGLMKMLYTLTPGWFFGETPHFLGVSTGLYFQTEEASVLYKIPGAECERLLAENALFRNRIITCFAHKLLMLRHEIANLTFNSCQQRIRRLLCAAVNPEGEVEPGWYALRMHYTHSEIAEIVGGARVTVSRLITELSHEGFLRVVNRRLQISAPAYAAFCAARDDQPADL